MIKLHGLVKSFGNTRAVNGLDLEIGNELFVFLGPNGAGKTTTINMMTGLLPPNHGDISLNNIDLLKAPVQAKAQFGLVMEEPFLYEKLTGREFIELMAAIHRVPAGTAAKRADQLLNIFEIAGRAGDYIEDYSHGMKQKIAIIAALIHDPHILILDEPTSGLDPKAVRNLKDLLRGWVNKGRTVFMSTHILEIAETMCDRIGIIHQGKLAALGTPDEIRESHSGDGSLEDLFLEITGAHTGSDVDTYLQGQN